MNSAVQRLTTLRVSDVMARQVIPVEAHQTMEEAAALLARHGISAAPVTDEQGRVVGILSATDFLKREVRRESTVEESEGVDRRLGPAEQGWEIQPVAEDLVSAHMTTAVQSIPADSRLLTAAKMMNAQHVHRLVVIDESSRPIGMVSTMDVVAALLNALDEAAVRG